MTKLIVKITDCYLIKSNLGGDAEMVYEVLSIKGLDEARKLADKLGVILELVNHTDSVDCEEL